MPPALPSRYKGFVTEAKGKRNCEDPDLRSSLDEGNDETSCIVEVLAAASSDTMYIFPDFMLFEQ